MLPVFTAFWDPLPQLLYCTVLYCTVRYCTVLCHSVPSSHAQGFGVAADHMDPVLAALWQHFRRRQRWQVAADFFRELMQVYSPAALLLSAAERAQGLSPGRAGSRVWFGRPYCGCKGNLKPDLRRLGTHLGHTCNWCGCMPVLDAFRKVISIMQVPALCWLSPQQRKQWAATSTYTSNHGSNNAATTCVVCLTTCRCWRPHSLRAAGPPCRQHHPSRNSRAGPSNHGWPGA